MRPLVGIVLLTALLLQSCALPGGKVADEAADTVVRETAYVPQQGLSDKERFREVLYLLEEGEPEHARVELLLYLQSQPGSDVGRDLLRQIDLPADEYFPPQYREIELTSGWSLSSVSQHYLGSVFKFHALAKYNGIAEPRKLTVGQAIRVPLTPEARAAFDVDDVTEAQPQMLATEPPEPDPQIESPPAAEPADEPQSVVEVVPEAVPAVEPATPPPQPQPAVEAAAVSAPEAEQVPLSTERVEALHREALNAYRAQDLDRAISLWDEVLAADPDHENARLYRSQAVELRRKLSNLL